MAHMTARYDRISLVILVFCISSVKTDNKCNIHQDRYDSGRVEVYVHKTLDLLKGVCT